MSADKGWGQTLLIGAGVVAAAGALWYLYTTSEVLCLFLPVFLICEISANEKLAGFSRAERYVAVIAAGRLPGFV